MDIKYIEYEDKYYDDLKNITLTSFKLTSFNTDKFFSSLPDNGNKTTWELWCKPVLESDKNKYCIVAVKGRKAVGYIIYGADAGYSKILNLRIGSIILMAVHNKFQGEYHIAFNLLKNVIDIYNRYRMNIISAGTDLDNLPAIINYINSGFKPVLFWSTFRFYPDNDNFPEEKNIQVIENTGIRLADLKRFDRPVSFLMDKRIERRGRQKLDSYIQRKNFDDIKKGKFILFELTAQGKRSGFISLLHEQAISGILNKELYRINNIIFFDNNLKLNISLMRGFLNYFKKLKNNKAIIEVFIKSNDWDLMEVLTKSNFVLIHNALTLHKFL